MPRWAARVVVVVLVVLLGLMVVAVGRSTKDYGTPAFWAAPDRVNYCGRRYYRIAKTVNGSPTEFVHSQPGTTWRAIGRTFGLRHIYATVVPHPQANVLCAGSVYVARPLGGYTAYDLSGGP